MTKKFSYIVFALITGLILLVGISLLVGAYDLSFSAFVNVLQQNVLAATGADHGKVASDSYLLFQIRLPRILMAGITGAGLAITGAAIQGLFRNPLADPSLIGITSGAMLFAVLAIVTMSTVLAAISGILQQFLIEALVVSALGGVLGVALGLGAAALVAYFGTPIHYALMPVVLAFSCAFLTGLVFGYLPARKAARLDPVAALATE